MAPTLFQRVLGAPFFTLPPAVRALHAVHGQARYAGRVRVQRGRNPLARLFGALAGLPRAMDDAPLVVTFTADAEGERWRREFGDSVMASRLWGRRGRLHERLGTARLRFDLHVNDGVLYWNAAGLCVFGVLPVPAAWLSGVRCEERERDGRYVFLVEAALPLAGRVIRYEGWLEPA